MNKKWYEWLPAAFYAAMLALCLFLNLTGGQREGLSNLIVNAVMFAVVAVIFISCEKNSFAPMREITADLDRITGKIRSDALNSHDYLWEPYSSENADLFRNERLKSLYQDYLFELNRVKNAEHVYYKTGIDAYINEELVDSVMHRNQLNQVAGTLTGLGILGTFIGLSLGLQHFNTGSTAAITGSIEPLMGGIKVAFHTSIYGIIFSLVFNYVYKRKLYESEESIVNFITAWKKYVLPDTADDGINRIIELEEKQLDTLKQTGQRLSEEISSQLEPHFAKLNKLITDFQAVATADQREALSHVVNDFTAEMNRSLGGAFSKISAEVDEQYRLQQQNAEMMREYYRNIETVQSEIQKDVEADKLLKSEHSRDIQAMVNACREATELVGDLKGEVERLARSRRKPL